MLRFLGLALGLALVGVTPAQLPDIRRDFILTDKDAVGMLAPRVVCNAYAHSLRWSPDGTTLLVQHADAVSTEAQIQAMISNKGGEPAPPKQELVFYSMRSNRIKATVPLDVPQLRIRALEWLPGSSQVVCQFTKLRLAADGTPESNETDVVLISSDGRVRPIASVEDLDGLDVSVSPRSPLVAVIRSEFVPPAPGSGQMGEVTGEITFVPATGSPKAPIKLPPGYCEFQWGADGRANVCIREYSKDRKSISNHWRQVDLSTGQFGPPVRNFEPAPVTTHPSIGGLVAVETQFKAALPRPVGDQIPSVNAVGLVSDRLTADSKAESGFAFASTDGVEGVMAPSGDAVAYIHHGVAMVRPIIRMPKEAFLAALAAAKRMELISNAKQVGLGLLMYAADNDDNLPSSGTLQDSINPYLRNKDLMNGFVFSLSGGNVSKVEEPATTEMGYIPGPGGRAVVYADGHVKWISNP